MLKSISSKFIRSFIIISLLIAGTAYAGNPERSKNGMVVTASPLASNAGTEILRKGGNAVDAAVAVGFALAVTYPTAGNIGGGGFMVIHLADGTNTTFDFRETAPLAASQNMYLDSLSNYNSELSQSGWLSSGVPGSVHGLISALEKYGSMELADVIQPAIDLAENGFNLTYDMAESINKYYNDFMKYESSKKIFTNNGNKFNEGDLFVQKDLANTLKLIRDNGKEIFYKGIIADKFVQQSEVNGGIFTLEDFSAYKSIERGPVVGSYRGYEIISMGPSSSGGICLIEALNILENITFTTNQWHGSNHIHYLVEILKRVYADRSVHIGDPEFYNVPVDQLISKDYAKTLFDQISDSATASLNLKAGEFNYYESPQTTHYSVADKFGNAVSTTVTLNSAYGNKIVVDGLGFLLNNEMDDFSSKPGSPNQYGLIGSKANSIEPKKRMLSSMTPTIILKEGKPFMVIGSPGGSTIITQVLQTVQNVIDFNMNIYDAIAAPRIHHQWLPDKIDYEPFSISDDTRTILKGKGHIFGKELSLGRMEGIIIDHETNLFYGATDPRGYGKAEGF
ncbi:MAG: gamma-glutamyltransferase [Bacteroidota bacterium]